MVPGLVGLEEQAVHVGDLDGVVVEKYKLADAAAREHLSRDAPDPTNTDHCAPGKQSPQNEQSAKKRSEKNTAQNTPRIAC